LIQSLLLSMMLSAFGATCPVDSMQAYFTGRTQTMSGRLMYEYRCPSGHTFLVRQ